MGIPIKLPDKIIKEIDNEITPDARATLKLYLQSGRSIHTFTKDTVIVKGFDRLNAVELNSLFIYLINHKFDKVSLTLRSKLTKVSLYFNHTTSIDIFPKLSFVTKTLLYDTMDVTQIKNNCMKMDKSILSYLILQITNFGNINDFTELVEDLDTYKIPQEDIDLYKEMTNARRVLIELSGELDKSYISRNLYLGTLKND